MDELGKVLELLYDWSVAENLDYSDLPLLKKNMKEAIKLIEKVQESRNIQTDEDLKKWIKELEIKEKSFLQREDELKRIKAELKEIKEINKELNETREAYDENQKRRLMDIIDREKNVLVKEGILRDFITEIETDFKKGIKEIKEKKIQWVVKEENGEENE